MTNRIWIKTPKLSAATESDEAAAMAAMFKAQTDIWEETQEKMAQSVLASCYFPCVLIIINMLFVTFGIVLQCHSCVQYERYRAGREALHESPRASPIGPTPSTKLRMLSLRPER